MLTKLRKRSELLGAAAYPIRVNARAIETEQRPDEGDERSFDTEAAAQISSARLASREPIESPLLADLLQRT